MLQSTGDRPFQLPRVAPEGYPIIAGGLGLTAAIAPFSRRLAMLPLSFAVASAFFFRDPIRALPTDPGRIMAAADGIITRVEHVDEPRFIGGPALRVATFLSLFDVHINRAPVSGTVRFLEHVPGDFSAAWQADAHEHNERNYIGLETEHGPVLMIQIAGLVARRIVCHLRDGDHVQAGQRVGLIRFGSRTDVLVPLASAQPRVVAGTRVKAGTTIIGMWDAENAGVEAPIGTGRHLRV